MTYRTLLLWVLLVGCLLPPASAQPARISFDGDWKFSLGNAGDPSRDFNYGIANIFSKSGAQSHTALDLDFEDSSWQRVQLPHDWAEELPFVNSTNPDVMAHGYRPVGGLFPQTSIGWYRKKFIVPAQDSAKRTELVFDGIFRNASVWINGFYLGNNLSGYLGVSYDLSDYLHYGKENLVVVRVDATQYEGWFYEGAGIYRHAWLEVHPPVHIVQDGVFVHSALRGTGALVTVETTLTNQGLRKSACRLKTLLLERGGRLCGEAVPRSLILEPNETRTVIEQIFLHHPRLWSTGDPYLYRVMPVVEQQGRSTDSKVLRTGIRTIEVRPDGVFVNGRYEKIQGVNCHQDHGGLGSALPDYLQYYRIGLLRDMGVNAYRTSHHAPTPELLDACDSLGVLVLDEQRLLNSSPEYISQFERLIKRDRSRACVFLWSIGNEEGWVQTTPQGKKIAQRLLSLQKQWDPTRTSTYAADLGNEAKGINEVIPVRGFNYRIGAVDAYHRDHPGQPVIGTEMGSTVTTRGIYVKDSLRCYLPDEDITAPWWANTAEQWWSLASRRPWWSGGFVWTGFDYRGEPTPFGWPNINSHFGVMDICGFPKNIYYYYQSWWTDRDVLHISPHWNWPGKEGQPVNVWVNSNADRVELFLNGKSFGQKDMPRDSHLEWSVPYEPGTLLAVAYKKGRVLRSSVETTGPATELVLSPSRTTMLADGRDACVINIHAIDRQGRDVPDADNLVRFIIRGEARVIGLSNGDPSSHESDKPHELQATRRLFNGRCQLILQAGMLASGIHVEATSDGLTPGATDLFTIPPPPNPHRVTPPLHARVKASRGHPSTGKILGADISFLPELEHRGMKFYDSGQQKDALEILKAHGFNYIRLRIFHDPSSDSGYSPHRGFCDLSHTLAMAKRIRAAHMKFLLDFHYSDYWADPGKQRKPRAWEGLSFEQMKDSVYAYTRQVMEACLQAGTPPDMVQVGNEINHGILWPEGHVSHMDSLANLLYAAILGVRAVVPGTAIMIHLALGGQHDEARFFLDNLCSRAVPFDIIGLSYYPRWHGSTEDLASNMRDLANHYQKDLVVVEYSACKEQVNGLAFNLPESRGLGTFIWEPLNTWEKIFDQNGQANSLMALYDDISKKYLKRR